jgi:hypothetical protein
MCKTLLLLLLWVRTFHVSTDSVCIKFVRYNLKVRTVATFVNDDVKAIIVTEFAGTEYVYDHHTTLHMLRACGSIHYRHQTES